MEEIQASYTEKKHLQLKTEIFQSSSCLARMASTHRARKRIREAKRKARPELATREMWVQNDYANTFDLSWERVTSFTNPPSNSQSLT